MAEDEYGVDISQLAEEQAIRYRNYKKKIKERWEILNQQMQDKEQWNLFYNKDGIRCHTKPNESGFNYIRSEVFIPNVNLFQIVNLTWDIENISKWDKTCYQAYDVEDFSASFKVVYHAFKAPWPAEDRDFVFVTCLIPLEDSSIIQFMTSIEHPDVPIKQNFVRGNIISGCFKYLQDVKGVFITYVNNVDPKGMVPASIVNIVNKDSAMIVQKIKEMFDSQTF